MNNLLLSVLSVVERTLDYLLLPPLRWLDRVLFVYARESYFRQYRRDYRRKFGRE